MQADSMQSIFIFILINHQPAQYDLLFQLEAVVILAILLVVHPFWSSFTSASMS